MGKNHNVHGGQGKDGQGKGKPKLRDRDLGKALIKQQERGSMGMNGRLTKEKRQMMSILDSSNLSDYVDAIEMEGKDIQVKRTHMNDAFLVEPATNKIAQHMSADQFNYEHLKIPRKPAWNRNMTAEEVDRNEKDAFIRWRREIAQMEEAASTKTTPFEKNIEVWRQLWRVLERSDMAIQIVDARNPLLYYTHDLMQYAAEQSPPRPMMLLVNKADFLTEHQRRVWARYFDSAGIRFAFYSAFNEQEKIERAAQAGVAFGMPSLDVGEETVEVEDAESEDDSDAESEDGDDEDDGSESESESDLHPSAPEVLDREEVQLLAHDLAQQWRGELQSLPHASSFEHTERELRRSRVLTRSELILLLSLLPHRLGIVPQERNNGRVVVGMLGFPNVGKSSVINTILGVSKAIHGVLRVGVSSTPGKTKHFQTLQVSPSLMLCDCPGLVFPSFMRSTGEMLCAGILPINQMRDYSDPASVISSRVPAHMLEAAYGITIRKSLDVKDNPDRPPTGSEVLCAYCATKGYITNGTGRWDEFRACKELLRDFTDGHILYVSPPPSMNSGSTDGSGIGMSVAERSRWMSDTEIIMMRREKIAERIAVRRLKETDSEESQVARKNASRVEVAEHGEFVFGDGSYDEVDEDDDEEESEPQASIQAVRPDLAPSGAPAGPIFDDESDSDDDDTVALGMELGAMASNLTPQGLPKREHKRLKHWGKKNKKNWNKDPYGLEGSGVVSYIAYSTNRTLGGKKDVATLRHNSLAGAGANGGGAAFVRQALPHHKSSL